MSYFTDMKFNIAFGFVIWVLHKQFGFHRNTLYFWHTMHRLSMIYLWTCKLQYKGKLQNLLHIHLNTHHSDIHNKKLLKPVATHFNMLSNSMDRKRELLDTQPIIAVPGRTNIPSAHASRIQFKKITSTNCIKDMKLLVCWFYNILIIINWPLQK